MNCDRCNGRMSDTVSKRSFSIVVTVNDEFEEDIILCDRCYKTLVPMLMTFLEYHLGEKEGEEL